MAKTLIVKGADFETNALEQVVIEVIECTGISLDKDTLSIATTGNTGTLIATKTPTDATQPVVWSTSDSDVVTVNNGTVTAVGVGSATITVTCGNYSDTCAVTITEFMNKANLKKNSGAYIGGEPSATGGNGIMAIQTSDTYANRGFLASSEGTKYASNATPNYVTYPYIMPKNTKRVKITDTGTSGIKKQTICWFSSTVGSATLPEYAQMVDTTALSSVSTNPYIVDVPTHEGYPEIDSLAIMFRTYKSGTTFVDADFDDVTIEFLPAETT